MSSGSVSPHAVSTPDVVHRVAISTRGLSYSHLEAAEADLPSAGNRFDVPGAGVLYCCTELEGCYRETLARLRTSPRMRIAHAGPPQEIGSSDRALRAVAREFDLSLN